MKTSQQDAYDAGLVAGRVGQRLDQHDYHFNEINGSIHGLTGEMRLVNLALAEIKQQMTADAVTRIATAQALKDYQENLRAASEQRWTPLSRLYLVLSILIAVAVLGGFVYTLVKH